MGARAARKAKAILIGLLHPFKTPTPILCYSLRVFGMHMGFARCPRASRKAIPFEDERWRPHNALAYRPPLIFSKCFGMPITELPAGLPHGKEAGTYEVKATGDGVKAYGFLWLFNSSDLEGIETIHHRQVCQILKKLLHIDHEFGRVVLGGGFMLADYDTRTLTVFGQSGDYGRVPSSMQSDMLRRLNFSVRLAGHGGEIASPGMTNYIKARDWYLSHGMEVEM